MKNGLIIIDKPMGISSQAVVNRTKRALGVKKAGHTGTLDPMATGVLPVLVGRGVKASEYLLTEDKHYLATLTLGIETDTEDTTGKILRESDDIPGEAEVRSAALSMLGSSIQIPPMYSAIKKDGKKLYELARLGQTVEREGREIFIKSISVSRISERDYALDVECSKGTYIRTLCADIGAKLGCGGAMKALCRLEAAGYTLDDAVSLEELEEMTEEQKLAHVRPVEDVFPNLIRVDLSGYFARLARNGLEIYLHKIGKTLEEGRRVKLFDENGFFALGEVRMYEDGLAVKPIKQFDV